MSFITVGSRFIPLSAVAAICMCRAYRFLKKTARKLRLAGSAIFPTGSPQCSSRCDAAPLSSTANRFLCLCTRDSAGGCFRDGGLERSSVFGKRASRTCRPAPGLLAPWSAVRLPRHVPSRPARGTDSLDPARPGLRRRVLARRGRSSVRVEIGDEVLASRRIQPMRFVRRLDRRLIRGAQRIGARGVARISRETALRFAQRIEHDAVEMRECAARRGFGFLHPAGVAR